LKLSTLSADEYVREVLPHSRTLWAGERSFEEYVDDFRTIAGSAWGKRRFRTVGLRVEGRLVASCKRYERVLRCGARTFRAIGIGAVFTPEAWRGRGYATALLGALLDAERAAGADLAYLFSDIHPAFYERLGFVALPSRAMTLRADALPDERVEVTTLGDRDATAIRRTFEQLDERRPFALRRMPLDWEWQRLRNRSRERGGPLLRLGVRRGRTLAAYVAGRRLPAADAFALDEFAFAVPDDARCVGPLLRAAAGDLRRVRGWLPPEIARDALPAGAVRPRREAIAMLIPIGTAFRAAWREWAPRIAASRADPCWSTDHI
jgi:GNAT superfamily N-acetyltransferase